MAVHNHTGQVVADLERASRFYTEVLGFRHWHSIELPDEPTAQLLGLSPPLGVRVEYLTLEDVLSLIEDLGVGPIRDIGLLGSAVARPQTTVGGHDAYPDLWSKAAALLQSIVKNHALIDGNTRLGWLATAVFLELNHASVAAASNADVYELVMDVAANDPELETIASRLQRLAATRP